MDRSGMTRQQEFRERNPGYDAQWVQERRETQPGFREAERARVRISRAKRDRDHPLYRTWASMKQRCGDPGSKSYPNYGGRGIKVHDEWWGCFARFETWVMDNLGPRPEGMTLDRIDNDGHYAPGNLRWATRVQQRLNRRDSR